MMKTSNWQSANSNGYIYKKGNWVWQNSLRLTKVNTLAWRNYASEHWTIFSGLAGLHNSPPTWREKSNIDPCMSLHWHCTLLICQLLKRFIYLFANQGDTERWKHRDLSSTCVLSKQPQQPGLVQTEARGLEFQPGLLCEWQGPRDSMFPSIAFLGALAGSWPANGTAGTWTHTLIQDASTASGSLTCRATTVPIPAFLFRHWFLVSST